MKKPLAQAYQKILLPGSWYRFKEGSELGSGFRPRAGGIPLIYSSVSSWSQGSSVAGVCEPPQVGCYRVVREGLAKSVNFATSDLREARRTWHG